MPPRKASGPGADSAHKARRGDLLRRPISAEANSPPAKLQGRSRPSATNKTRAGALAEQLLRDRAERAARKAAAPTRLKDPESDFDPFAIIRWRAVEPKGGNPGHLVKARMRRGPVGWFIACRARAREFESKGWAYCPHCMVLPAEERRDQPKLSGRICERPGCNQRLSMHSRADAQYCSAACRKAASRDKTASGPPDTAPPEMSQLEGPESPIKRPSLIGLKDFPINIIGGVRFPQAKPNPLGRVCVRPWS
jgi:hypothetical protein